MSHPGACTVESEEREERGSGRSQNVVHTLPRSMASVPSFLTGPLERVDPAQGATQLLVITPDAESALGLAEAVLRLTGPAGIELLPVTSARRASRLIAGRPVLAAAGSPREIRDLVRGSHLKLDGIKSVVLAWADEILAGDAGDIEALEAVMSELPRDAARIVVTSRTEGRVNAFAERYLRRAHRDLAPDAAEEGEPIALQYVTVAPTARGAAFRRLLDDLDPPSATVIAAGEEAEEAVRRTLRLLGYADDSAAVRVSRGATIPATHAVIFYDLPSSRTQLAAAVAAAPVSLVVLVEPRELGPLKRMAGGKVRPFTLSAPGNAAREREAGILRELSSLLDAGVASRELLALEPLLERHDGIEIAAAALRLLEKERGLRKGAEAAASGDTRPPREARTPDAGEKRPAYAGVRDMGARDRPPRGAGRGRPPRPGGFRDSRGPRDSGSGRGAGPSRGGKPGRPSGGGGSRPPRRDRP